MQRTATDATRNVCEARVGGVRAGEFSTNGTSGEVRAASEVSTRTPVLGASELWCEGERQCGNDPN